ncbi:MAG: DUF58 domain-containing protein [Chloroflexota bacterium]
MGIPMFNESWVALSILLIFLGWLLGQPGLVTVASLLLTVAGVSWLWDKYALHGIEYERSFSERRVFVGEEVSLTIRVTNRKLLPLSWLRVDDQVPADLPLLDGRVSPSFQPELGYLSNLFALRWYERVGRTYRLRPHRRGFYTFGPVRLQSGDFFGLFTRRETLQKRNWLIVYPQVRPLAELGLPPKDPFGDVKAPQHIFEDPIRTVGVREYQPGDSFRRIHWKASARLQRYQSRIFEPTTSHQLAIFLNVATFPKAWQGIVPDVLEEAISVAASIASFGAAHKYQVGLLANGSMPNSDQALKVLPGRNPRQLARILEALAAVTGFATTDIERMLIAESPHLSWGATLLIVTATFYDELLATLLRLRDAGRRLVLISLDARCPDLSDQGIRTFIVSQQVVGRFAPPDRKPPADAVSVEPVMQEAQLSPWARPAAGAEGP